MLYQSWKVYVRERIMAEPLPCSLSLPFGMAIWILITKFTRPTRLCKTYKERISLNQTQHVFDIKLKCSLYRPGVAQRVGRGIALLVHDRGTRRWWVVSSTPRPHFTPRKDLVPIIQEAGWAPGPVWTGGKSRPYRDSIPDSPARSSVAIPIELPGPHMYLTYRT